MYALEEIDGDLFISSEYVEGRTLRDEIASGRRPSPQELLETARELTAAIGSAHARGTNAGARDAGKLRVEGKTYEVKDGDVLHFLHGG